MHDLVRQALPLIVLSSTAACDLLFDDGGSDGGTETAVGTYAIDGSVGTNTCGDGIQANDTVGFSVDLAEEGDTLYLTDEVEEISGGYDTGSATAATFVSASTSNVGGTGAAAGPCNLTFTKKYALTFSGESPPASFTGTLSYTYAVATGISSNVDCTAQLASSGGPYDTLPCSVTYAIKGTMQ